MEKDTGNFATETSLLLSRLEPGTEGLEKVFQNKNFPVKAAEELLRYFRNRKNVTHLVERFSLKNSTGDYAGKNDFRVANDALKHVFISQSAYPPSFCGDDINWNSRPVPDNEWLWQLHRMYFWNSMARVYMQTGNEEYAREWGAQLLDWIKKNPNDEAHKYAWRSIEAGIRGHSWTDLFQYFLDSPSFTPEILVALLNSFYDHAEYLMTTYRSKSNWSLMEAEGLAFISITFPEFKEAGKWRTEAIRRLNNEINLQVYPDGHQRELAIGYHLGSIQWFLRTYKLAQLNNLEHAFPESYFKTIELMCEVPMKLGLPDGTNAQFGDAWVGKPGQHKHKYQEWAKMFSRNDFLFLSTEGKQGSKPDSTAYALPYSGLYSMRSGWDKNAICLVLKCGPNGGGHCQPDNGTFTLYAGGRTLMPDAGSYIYSGDAENRAWFRQTKVHQTLTLNGENSKYEPKLLLWKPDDELDILVVENQSYENLAHRRSVFFVDKRYFVIVDQAFGSAGGEVEIHFQLAPEKEDATFNYINHSVHSNFSEGWNIWVQSMMQPGMELKEELGQVSFEYTKKEPRPAFAYNVKKNPENTEVRFVTVVAPYFGEVPHIQVEVMNADLLNQKELFLKTIENEETKKIGYNL
ncbi:MAG: alginate lyase family protein [Draconibacterium sp.]